MLDHVDVEGGLFPARDGFRYRDDQQADGEDEKNALILRRKPYSEEILVPGQHTGDSSRKGNFRTLRTWTGVQGRSG